MRSGMETCLRPSPATSATLAATLIVPRRFVFVVAFVCVVAYLMLSCRAAEDDEAAYDQPYRPQYHFTPSQNWMNDPNGLVYHDGEYHLFYQHNPSGDDWGNLSWGHAVSEDLVHWEQLPVALEAKEDLHIYSGSAVFDAENTSGLGSSENPPLVAIYTGHHRYRNLQDQRIAYSLDNGRSWSHYDNNPVIDEFKSNFRDPKVFRHEESDRWIMAVALPTYHKIRFYSSADLINWEFESEFGPAGATGGHWECPDLFRLPVENRDGEHHWVLQVDINSGAVAGGSGAQYFVGSFDGSSFEKHPDTEGETLWVDYGADFYAVQSYDGVPGDRRIWLAWMNNWNYARNIPTDPWRGAMTVPREVGLVETSDGPRLIQRPVPELRNIRADRVTFQDVPVSGDGIRHEQLRGAEFELNAELEVGDAEVVGMRVRSGDEEETIVEYDVAGGVLRLDRSRSGRSDFHPEFPGRIQTAPLELQGGRVSLRILVDRSSIELFADDGRLVLTSRIFPSSRSDDIEIFAKDGSARVTTLDFWPLGTIWE